MEWEVSCKGEKMSAILDTFCGDGGCSVGYKRAGFDVVVGVDIEAHPRYPFAFVQGDAIMALETLIGGGSIYDACGMAWELSDFDAVHASPPCQRFCKLRHMATAKDHPDLIAQVRDLLKQTGKPYVIENIEGAPLDAPVILCGTMFGLGAGDAVLERHRLFEQGGFTCTFTPPHRHIPGKRVIGVYGHTGGRRLARRQSPRSTIAERKQAMGIDWMSGAGLSQAIPPAYAEFIGRHLLDAIRNAK